MPGQYELKMYLQVSLLYDHQPNNESRYLLSVCNQSQHLIAQSNITAATITSARENYTLVSILQIAFAVIKRCWTINIKESIPLILMINTRMGQRG